ncbi:MAG: hypothetical protein ACI9MR_002128, partial [Myxococcota bacterium]
MMRSEMTRQIVCILFVLSLALSTAACGETTTPTTDSIATPGSGMAADGGTRRATDGSAEHLVLPDEPVWEPCDGVDNNGDGFTDPHCPTAECTSSADCTYGELVSDADCNPWEQTRQGYSGCNQIDGVANSDEAGSTNDCHGMLCPAGQKCVNGA